MNDDRQIVRCLNETPQEVISFRWSRTRSGRVQKGKWTHSSFDLFNMEQESGFFFNVMFKAGKSREKKHCGKSCIKISLLVRHFFIGLQGFLWHLDVFK